MEKNSIVESVLNLHSNQLNSSSQDTGLVTLSKDGYEKISSLTLYVPENINIDRLLDENPPDFKYKRDCFVYILHLITSIPAGKRDIIDNSQGFTPINKKFLQARIHNYNEYINYLKRHRIIEENRQYKPGKFSRGLKFAQAYQSKVIPVRITEWTLIKNIEYLNRNYNVELTEELSYLKRWFNDELEIDYEGGINYLNELYESELCNGETSEIMLRYNSRLLPFLRLKNKEFSFHVDNTGFRLHTNITQLMGGLRRFVKYGGKRLCAIDIKNSQPFLAISLLDDDIFTKNNMDTKITNPKLTTLSNYPIMVVEKIRRVKNEPDVLQFIENVASGNFYEGFARVLIENGLVEPNSPEILREQAKEITFCSIYSPNSLVSSSRYVQLFKELYPNVYSIFKLIKKGHGNHPAFSICLQRLEAELVLHKVCKVVSDEMPDVFITTLHDSVITTEDNVEYVESIMYNVLKEFIGVEPKLKRERWN
ncbi:hypothetical protein [Flavobacterium sp. TBRC 19031]|uniref:hypothetical protein n=1 Tax=Flavobacterium mekongense TaxID=3379707 RepID=UPI00399B9B0D